jgi:hypothetical protein
LPKLAIHVQHEAEAKELKEAVEKLEYILKMRVQIDLQNAWKLYRRLVSAFVIHKTRIDLTEVVKKLSSLDAAPLEKTKLPASQNRRLLYGLNPIKQRLMEVREGLFAHYRNGLGRLLLL